MGTVPLYISWVRFRVSRSRIEVVQWLNLRRMAWIGGSDTRSEAAEPASNDIFLAGMTPSPSSAGAGSSSGWFATTVHASCRRFNVPAGCEPLFVGFSLTAGWLAIVAIIAALHSLVRLLLRLLTRPLRRLSLACSWLCFGKSNCSGSPSLGLPSRLRRSSRADRTAIRSKDLPKGCKVRNSRDTDDLEDPRCGLERIDEHVLHLGG